LFERFTDRARRVLVLAQEEARDLNHAFIGTEHILLGLIREGEGVAAKALDALGVTFDVDQKHGTPYHERLKAFVAMAQRQNLVIGGTSAVAPLWAGLIALSNQQNGTSAGFIQPQIYAAKAASAFRDIVSGNNGAFSAGPGWDACTGLGSPVGARLIPLLGSSTAPTKKKGKGKKPVRLRPARKKTSRR